MRTVFARPTSLATKPADTLVALRLIGHKPILQPRCLIHTHA